ncbi:zinc-dependent metalloprotease [Catellatospora tritici]|uniref:zinc-dependent metalloprotease n=1 Tax=Catellatospora tritici TaxID=2851566 RepID=UPI001C2D89D8|nr:zinc-dependent metalloprotease [Catellatospora tritici]MBV1853426.1 zinc-dependent metalloprotease [Catellatospora tritici]
MALVDWDLATSAAARFGPTGPSVTYEQANAAVRELRELADEAVAHVSAYTGLTARVDDAPVRVVDRRTWAEVNIRGLRQVIHPLTDKLEAKVGVVGNLVGAKVTAVETGAVLGYLSGKVLGQYEVFATDPGQLLLVAPNIVGMERRIKADPRDFRLWVCLHEVTHRTQFTAVPWLREHFLGEVRRFVEATEPPTANVIGQTFRQVEAAVKAAKSAAGDERGTTLLDAMQTPQQRAVLDRLTAILTLLEGHAEVVMDGVGPRVIPSVAQIRAAFDRRRNPSNPVEQYLRRLLGIDIKMRQYAEGRAFVQGVLDRVGMDGFNKIWTSPQTLPRPTELTDPGAWVARVATPATP